MPKRTIYTNFFHYFLSFPRPHELTQNYPFDHYSGLGIFFAADQRLIIHYSAYSKI